MSIFRVEKNKNYTIISNYHLRDKNLSLRTIGLLSLILSLPENWDYSQAGLAAICKDGEDSIRSGLKELEKHGYLERERERDESGKMRGVIYRVYEVPKNQREEVKRDSQVHTKSRVAKVQKAIQPKSVSPKLENPMLDSPFLDSPILESPTSAIPISGQQRQLIKDRENINIIKTDLQTNQSTNPQNQIEEGSGVIGRKMGNSDYEKLKKYIQENINYDFFKFKAAQIEERFDNQLITSTEYEFQTAKYDMKKIDQVVGYMLDILSSINDDPIKIGNEIISREVVKSKLMRIKMLDIQKTIVELNTNVSIKNPKKYAISMLYNA